MWIFIGFIIVIYVIYVLWKRVNALENPREPSKEMMKIRFSPKKEFYNIPLIREAIGLDKKDWDKPLKDLSEEQLKKFHEWRKEHERTFHKLYTFFPDRQLFFCSEKYGSYFFDLPYKTTKIVAEEISDDGEINFIIAFRWIEGILPKRPIPIYEGYLKKGEGFGKDEKKEIVTLFQVPHYFIDPSFIKNKKFPEFRKILEDKFGLEKKEDDHFPIDYTNDFGEHDWFNDRGIWHETKYYEIEY